MSSQYSQFMGSQYGQLAWLLLSDPETGEPLTVMTNLKKNEDGTYSFAVRNPDTGRCWRHIILTVETTKK